MATLRPFRAYRPARELAAEVASRPYDVLSTEEARAEAAGNPLSFLRVGRAEIELPPGTGPHSPQVYARARENLRRLVALGVLRQDAEPSLYLYGLTMGSHTQYGIAGCVTVDEYRRGLIRKHEQTRPDKEDDRTRHILATGAHTGPVLLTYRAVPAIDALAASIAARPPEADFVAADGVRLLLWAVPPGPELEEAVRLFSGVPLVYIADGHHRSAAAVRAAQEYARRDPAGTGAPEYLSFLAVLFPHDQLRTLEYNRLVEDLNGFTRDRFLEMLRRDFDVEKARGRVCPMRKGEFGLYTDGSWYLLTAGRHLPEPEDPVERLDVSLLQHRVLAPLLGIEDPRRSRRVDFVGGIRGAGELEHRVNSGQMAAAFTLFPTSIGELLAIADAERIMPPKSTWFEPKLRDGLLVHMLDRADGS